MTKRLCLRGVGRQQRRPAGWASQPASGPHNQLAHGRPLLPMPRSPCPDPSGVCFNSRSTARRWQGTEPVLPQD
eukprot:364534-Chlamydomonas_euryale.AAC.2